MEIRTTVVESRERGYQMASQEKRLSCKGNKQCWSEKKARRQKYDLLLPSLLPTVASPSPTRAEEGGRTRKKKSGATPREIHLSPLLLLAWRLRGAYRKGG